jgi:hypothetical protein
LFTRNNPLKSRCIIKRDQAKSRAKCDFCVPNCVPSVSQTKRKKAEKAAHNRLTAKNNPCKSMTYRDSVCPGLDSNQHTFRRCYLKAVRLPISPPGHLPYSGVQI